jgi:uncharacterized OB-fold protein
MTDERTTDERTRFEPPMSELGARFWEGTRKGALLLPWCTACERAHWYPREVCPFCLGDAIDWREASGSGVVYACSVMPKPAMPMMASRTPYVVAIVALAEGVRMMSNVVSETPFDVAVGDEVSLVWEPLSDGRQLPVWQCRG